MPYEDDIRAAFTALAGHAPDASRILTAIQARQDADQHESALAGKQQTRSPRPVSRPRLRARLLASLVAAAGVIAVAGIASHEAAGHRPHSGRPAWAVRWPVAFVAEGSQIVPVQTATGTAETPIAIPAAVAYNMAIAPDGKGYVDGETSAVVPVNLVTRTAGRPIRVRGGAARLAVTPDGRTGYVAEEGGVLPIDMADNYAKKPIPTPALSITGLAVTPDSRMLYMGGYVDTISGTNPAGSGEIVPVQTATNTALHPIVFSGESPVQFLITPDGKTVVTLNTSPGEVRSTVSQINVATGTVSAPVLIRARGAVSALVLAPDSKFAYVVSSGAVTPIDLATNTARPAISLPAGSGDAYNLVITPDGKRLYVLTPRKLVPISTVTGKTLTPIRIPGLDYPTAIAVNPNGKVLYVGSGHAIVPVSTATDRAGGAIALGGTGFSARAWSFAFRP
jgi:DNA-binding beta-propeller fold protein YncE